MKNIVTGLFLIGAFISCDSLERKPDRYLTQPIEKCTEYDYWLSFVWYLDMARNQTDVEHNTIVLFPRNDYSFINGDNSMSYDGTYEYKDSIVTLSPIKECPHKKLRLHKYNAGTKDCIAIRYGLFEMDSLGNMADKYLYYELQDNEVQFIPLVLK